MAGTSSVRDGGEEELQARRELLKRAAKLAATAPAVALLLRASSVEASGTVRYGSRVRATDFPRKRRRWRMIDSKPHWHWRVRAYRRSRRRWLRRRRDD